MKEKIAVLLPCYNEVRTVAKVVRDFRRELPGADIYVYDNNSSDGSYEEAKRGDSSVIVKKCIQQGKGHVVRRMFWEVDADVYVMVDSDDTYPADEVHKLIQPIVDGTADMVNGDRISTTYSSENKRPWHGFGNGLVCSLIRKFWNCNVNDVMTGYRAFSRRFVKSCPVLSNGFEIETEMTLHTLDKRLSLIEIPIQYRDRPAGSFSKLSTVQDGIRVLKTIFNLFRYYRPFVFFGFCGLVLSSVAFVLVVPIFVDYFKTGMVPRYPTLIFACFLMTASLLSFCIGLILDAVKKHADQTFEVMKNL